MTSTTDAYSPLRTRRAENAAALTRRLALTENSLQALGSGQIDAIIDPEGKTYLLRPAQEHLRENERRLQSLIDSVPDAITAVNRGGVILSQSNASRKVLGCEPEELMGKSIFEHIHADDFATVHSAFIEVIEGLQENAALQFRHRTSDGSYRIIRATVVIMHEVSPPTVVFSLRPAIDRVAELVEPVRRETAGPQSQLAKDRFLAMLAHELRTPLTPALLGVQELETDERFAAAGPVLAMIRRNIKLEFRLLEELFDFTAVGQNKLRLRSELIDTHEAIRLVLEICRSDIASAQVSVVIDLRTSDHFVIGDSAKLQQVMWNLLKNAIKFSAPGSTVSISTFDGPSDRFAMEFADHGIGIKPELLPFVFDSFQQGDLSHHQIHEGLGLGLFIAKGLAEAQGGTLTAFSEGHGKGAVFRLSLTKARPATHPLPH